MSIKRKIKKVLSSVLALSMLVPSLALMAPINSMAATTELIPENLGNGSSSASAYSWARRNGAGESATYRFDIRGIGSSGNKNYSTTDNTQLQTTYNNGGYATYIVTPLSNDSLSNNGTNAFKWNMEHNGGVQVIPTNHPSLGGVELKMTVTPAPDDMHILVDYYIHNSNDTSIDNVHFGSGADVMIAGDDGATVYKTNKGFLMVNRSNNSTFECITNDTALGTTPPKTRWMGYYGNYSSSMYTEGPDLVNNTDSGISFSWKIDELRPRETVHKRIAFLVKDTTFYVNPTSGVNLPTRNGTYAQPFKTIEYALSRLQSLNRSKAYINLMEDYDLSAAESSNIATFLSSGNKDITISSTDYSIAGDPIDYTANKVSLKRAAGNTDVLLQNGNGKLNLFNIILDGNNIEASGSMVSSGVGNGTINIMQGTEIKNAKVNTAEGSAINVTGAAHLSINTSKISDNITDIRGAVYFASSGVFSIRGAVDVSNNEDVSNQASNIYLGSASKIVVEDKLLDGSNIGVTTEGNITSTPLVITASSMKIEAPDMYISMFSSDLANQGVDVVSEENNIAFKRDPVNVRIRTTGVTPAVEDDIRPSNTGAVIPITVNNIQNYKLRDIMFVPENAEIRYFEGDTEVIEPDFSNLTEIKITVPDEAVTVRLDYEYITGGYEFRKYPYGNDSTERVKLLSGNAGAAVSGTIPFVSREGYDFAGWFDREGIALPVVLGIYPNEIKVYYPKWTANTNQQFTFNVNYVNVAGTLNFSNYSDDNIADTVISTQARIVPGYVLDSVEANPTHNDIGESTGEFDGTPLEAFLGVQPNEVLTALYTYKVSTDPADRKTFRIIHQDAMGMELSPDIVSQLFAETSIVTSPLTNITGYEYASAELIAGTVGGLSGNVFLTHVDEAIALNQSTGEFNASMPNQDVTLLYKYNFTGDGYDFTVSRIFEGTRLVNNETSLVPPHSTVTAQFRSIYGYQLLGTNVSPIVGSFDGNNDYSGTMPQDDFLVVTYEYEKKLNEWGILIYSSGANGSLDNSGTAVEVTASGILGEYETEIIMSDGTAEGEAGSYTWQQLLDKNLVPQPSADMYYMFDCWYIDANNNGVKDLGEEINSSTIFDLPNAKVYANFIEDPQWWIDIYFTAGEKGSLTGVSTLHTTKDQTWGDILALLPATNPNLFYMFDDWYKGTQKVNITDELENGAVYTAKFVKDPVIFGLNVQAPPAIGNVDLNGSGKITVYETEADYKYVIADMEGNVIAVQSGVNGTNRLTFPDLDPGTRYEVYEVLGTQNVNAGDTISSLPAANISAPTEVLIPVVDNNYVVTYDENNEGKTKIVINPADPEMDYAILDENGNVVITPETREDGWQTPSGNAPAVVEFSDLDYNKEYTIVAIPRDKADITPPSQKVNDGSVIITDPSGEIDIPKYIVETINGTVVNVAGEAVGNDRYDEVKAGDTVNISADSTNLAGEAFIGWEILVGNAEGITNAQLSQRNITFAMPKTNIVFYAKYNRTSTGNAEVIDEVRGGNRNEMSLDPNEIPNLEQALTQQIDRDLMNNENADVTYRVVFNKNKATVSERLSLRGISIAGVNHPLAFEAAWGLDVNIERYVNGRKVAMATPSNAQFTVITQLDSDDVDMLDYELYEIDTNGSISLVNLLNGDDPESTGGLFKFEATAGHRYLLVYSKAYRVTVVDRLDLDGPASNVYVPKFYQFKVRRLGNIMDSNYGTEYQWIQDNTPTGPSTDIEGVVYNFVGWSLNASPETFREFDLDTAIRKATIIYAYYEDNRAELAEERNAIDSLIGEALEVANDYILFRDESEYAVSVVTAAQERINAGILDPITNVQRELTVDEMRDVIADMEAALANPPAGSFVVRDGISNIREIVQTRREVYDNQNQTGSISSSGGSGAGGGSGNGSVSRPFVPTALHSYSIGVHGNWELEAGSANKWSFRLNGGIKLAKMWAWLEYTSGDVSRTGWYHFNSLGIMNSGWFQDEAGDWYYCNEEKDGWFGKMLTGWKLNPTDNNWYYLDELTGKMATGWKLIGGKWYYFTVSNNGPTYEYDAMNDVWKYIENSGRPVGSMYAGEITPDGYRVDASGAYVE